MKVVSKYLIFNDDFRGDHQSAFSPFVIVPAPISQIGYSNNIFLSLRALS